MAGKLQYGVRRMVKLSKSVAMALSSVEETVAGWPVSVSMDDVKRWLLQFDSEDYEIAVRVIKNLTVLGQEEINTGLQISNSKLRRKAAENGADIRPDNTIFAGVGDGGKSGGMISYYFRLLNGVSENNFIPDDEMSRISSGSIKNMVLIDDFIGSGGQASSEIEEVKKRVTPIGITNFYMLSVAGTKDGIEKIENETGAKTFCAYEYGPLDTIRSFDSVFYDHLSHEKKEAVLARLREYGEHLYSKHPLGYGNSGGLLAFHYNTPNNTIPIIWSDYNGWIPLFRRVTKIRSAISLLPKIKSGGQSKSSVADLSKLTVFVSGLQSEQFFREILIKKQMLEKLGISQIDVISMGTKLINKKFIDSIISNFPLSIFLLEETGRTKILPTGDEYKNNLYIYGANIFEFFDVGKIANEVTDDHSSENRFIRYLKRRVRDVDGKRHIYAFPDGGDMMEIGDSADENWASVLNRIVLFAGSTARDSLFRDLNAYIDTGKVEKMIHSIQTMISEQLKEKPTTANKSKKE